MHSDRRAPPPGGPRGTRNPARGRAGFTLIELMITVAIIAILAAVALPSYNSYVKKSRRSDAYAALAAVSLQQEKYRANNTTYGTLAQIGVPGTSPDGYYTIAITANSNTASGYTATATAVSAKGQNTDVEGSEPCGTLSLTMTAGALSYTPVACWKK